MKFTLEDGWHLRLFLSLCRRYGLKPFRRHGQRRSVPEVAERISIGTTTVRQLIHEGKVGCVWGARALDIAKIVSLWQACVN